MTESDSNNSDFLTALQTYISYEKAEEEFKRACQALDIKPEKFISAISELEHSLTKTKVGGEKKPTLIGDKKYTGILENRLVQYISGNPNGVTSSALVKVFSDYAESSINTAIHKLRGANTIRTVGKSWSRSAKHFAVKLPAQKKTAKPKRPREKTLPKEERVPYIKQALELLSDPETTITTTELGRDLSAQQRADIVTYMKIIGLIEKRGKVHGTSGRKNQWGSTEIGRYVLEKGFQTSADISELKKEYKKGGIQEESQDDGRKLSSTLPGLAYRGRWSSLYGQEAGVTNAIDTIFGLCPEGGIRQIVERMYNKGVRPEINRLILLSETVRYASDNDIRDKFYRALEQMPKEEYPVDIPSLCDRVQELELEECKTLLSALSDTEPNKYMDILLKYYPSKETARHNIK